MTVIIKNPPLDLLDLSYKLGKKMSIKEMTKSARIHGGQKSYKHGKAFEKSFEVVSRAMDIAVSRIPDGCRVVGINKLIRVKSPFDWVMSYQGDTALIDTKSIEDSCFHHSRIDHDQVKEMRAHSKHRTISGYVIFTKKNDKVFFVPSEVLWTKLSKGSIKFNEHGSLLLGSSSTFDPRKIFSLDIQSLQDR